MANTTVNLGMLPQNRGEYSSSATYYKDNIVQYNGSSYICTAAMDLEHPSGITGVAPYNSDPATPNTGWAVFSNDSSGVGEGVYNVSVDHTTDNQPKVYANLSAALNDIPAAKQKGGMSIKFIQGTVQNSDNKYAQYRLMTTSFNVDTNNWQSIEEPINIGKLVTPFLINKQYTSDGNIISISGASASLLIPAVYNDVIAISDGTSLYRVNMFNSDKVSLGQGGFTGGASFTINNENCAYVGITITTNNITNKIPTVNGNIITSYYAGVLYQLNLDLQQAINTEKNARQSSDEQLQQAINSEAQTRQSADARLNKLITPFLINRQYTSDGNIRIESGASSASLLIPAVYNDVIAISDGSRLYRVNMFNSNKESLGQGGFTGGTSFTINNENCAYVGITIDTIDIVNKIPTVNGNIITSYYINNLYQLQESLKQTQIDLNQTQIDLNQTQIDVDVLKTENKGNFKLFVNEPPINDIRTKVNRAIKELYIKSEYFVTGNTYLASVRKLQNISGTVYNVINIEVVNGGTKTSYGWYNYSEDYDFGNGLQLLQLSNRAGYILIDWNEIVDGTGYGSHSDLASDLLTEDVTNINRFPIINTLLSSPEDCVTLQQLNLILTDYPKTTELNNNYANKSITETQLSSHTSAINNIEDEQDNINNRITVINQILSNLTSALPDGSVSGDNNWLGNNTFAQPIIGVPAINDNELPTYGQVKNALHRNVDVADFGADPSKTASENTAAINNALLGGNKTVTITKPGTYLLNDTLLLDDNTELICSKGVILKKDTTYSFVIRNRGGATRSLNENIILRGIYIDCDYKYGEATPFSSPLYGSRGQILMFHVNNVKIFDVTIINAAVYAIQLCTFSNVLIDGFYITTRGDGVHVNRGEKLVCRNGLISSRDDACPLNASDWLGSCPEVGSIHDCVFENIIELDREDSIGGFARHLIGKWVDWYDGMSIVHGDKVVSNGHVYRANTGNSAETFISHTEPNCDSSTGSQSDTGGFTWRLCNEDAVYEADIYNISYKNIVSEIQRGFITAYYELGVVYSGQIYDRSLYPDVPTNEYPYIRNISIENINIKSNMLSISAYIKYKYIIRNSKVQGFIVKATGGSDDGFLIIDGCDFTNHQSVLVGQGGVLYLMNCEGTPNIAVTNKLISNSNVNVLPSVNIKGSRCMYSNEPYYNNGSSWISLI